MLAEWKDLEALVSCDVQLRSTAGSSQSSSMLSCLEVRPVLIEKIASKQKEDPVLAERIRRLEVGSEIDDLKDFSLDQRGWLRKKGRLCVPNLSLIHI